MNAGLVQFNQIWETKKANMEKIDLLLEKMKEKCTFLVFPELTLTGFTMRPERFAEDMEGETFSYFRNTALKQNAEVFAGMIEKKEEFYYNSLMHIGKDGHLKAIYRKIHPFSCSGENRHYKAGGRTVITELDGLKAGMGICYDLRFPELFRFYAKERADIIIIAANWPVTRINHWRKLLAARAIENQCFVAAVNRVGSDPELQYNGYSSIINPMGEVLTECEGEERVIVQEIMPESAAETREKLPFLQDIRLI